jgi:hypothetical protein
MKAAPYFGVLTQHLDDFRVQPGSPCQHNVLAGTKSGLAAARDFDPA